MNNTQNLTIEDYTKLLEEQNDKMKVFIKLAKEGALTGEQREEAEVLQHAVNSIVNNDAMNIVVRFANPTITSLISEEARNFNASFLQLGRTFQEWGVVQEQLKADTARKLMQEVQNSIENLTKEMNELAEIAKNQALNQDQLDKMQELQDNKNELKEEYNKALDKLRVDAPSAYASNFLGPIEQAWSSLEVASKELSEASQKWQNKLDGIEKELKGIVESIPGKDKGARREILGSHLHGILAAILPKVDSFALNSLQEKFIQNFEQALDDNAAKLFSMKEQVWYALSKAFNAIGLSGIADKCWNHIPQDKQEQFKQSVAVDVAHAATSAFGLNSGVMNISGLQVLGEHTRAALAKSSDARTSHIVQEMVKQVKDSDGLFDKKDLTPGINKILNEAYISNQISLGACNTLKNPDSKEHKAILSRCWDAMKSEVNKESPNKTIKLSIEELGRCVEEYKVSTNIAEAVNPKLPKVDSPQWFQGVAGQAVQAPQREH